MKATEILNTVKELLHLSKEEVKIEDVVTEEVVELSTEEVVEVIEEEVKEVVLAEESKEEEVVVDEVAEAPVANYVTSEDLSAVKTELLSMIKALIEDKAVSETKEVPQELSKQEEVELAEEVIHSPEEAIETKKNLLSNLNKPMTIEQRVNSMLFN